METRMRTMNVRERHLDFNGNGTVNINGVMANRFRKNGYSHVKYKGAVYSCSTVKWDLVPNRVVWVDGLKYS